MYLILENGLSYDDIQPETKNNIDPVFNLMMLVAPRTLAITISSAIDNPVNAFVVFLVLPSFYLDTFYF